MVAQATTFTQFEEATTVERAAKIHRVPLDEFLRILRTAVGAAPPRSSDPGRPA